MKPGLVSCVTPVYNEENYLGEMLDSVLKQTYPEVELILVDDGSTDRTLEVAESFRERFAQRGFRYQICSVPHQNAAAAINHGLALVQGEYLIWPDSDDVLHPDSIQKRVDFLRTHPRCQGVRSLMYYFDADGPGKRPDEPIGCVDQDDLFFPILENRTFVCCGCYLFKTERFFSLYPERRIPVYAVGQNFQMLLPYLYRYRCPTIPEPLYGVRQHPGGHSRRPRTPEEERKRYRDFERLMDELVRICGIRSPLERRRILCWRLNRRRNLARQQGRLVHAAAAEAALFLCGRSALHRRFLAWAKGWMDRRLETLRRTSLQDDPS